MTQPLYSPARYTGTNSTAVYSFGFRIFEDSNLAVIKTALDGTETVLSLGVDYTVTGAGLFSGGSITLLAGNLPEGIGLEIKLGLPLVQGLSIRNEGRLKLDNLEDALDRLTMYDQQQQQSIGDLIQQLNAEFVSSRVPNTLGYLFNDSMGDMRYRYPKRVELESKGTTVFNTDGSVVFTASDGQVSTTTFSGSVITEVLGAPIGLTKTTTFNTDGSITEV